MNGDALMLESGYLDGKEILKYTIKDGGIPDTVTMGMMTNADISTLVPASVSSVDGTVTVTYLTDGLARLLSCLGKEIGYMRLTDFLAGICDAYLTASDHLIPENSLVPDPGMIYFDPVSGKIRMICLPVCGGIAGYSAGCAFSSVLKAARPDSEQTAAFIRASAAELDPGRPLSIHGFKVFVSSLRPSGAGPDGSDPSAAGSCGPEDEPGPCGSSGRGFFPGRGDVSVPGGPPGGDSPGRGLFSRGLPVPDRPAAGKKRRRGEGRRGGAADAFGEAKPAQAVSGDIPYLVRSSGGVIPVTLCRFRIGKDPSASDYTVEGNRAVSRRHAVIEGSGRSWTVTDCSSTNHTYLDGRRLVPGRKYPLSPGCSLRLADEDFTFCFRDGLFPEEDQHDKT